MKYWVYQDNEVKGPFDRVQMGQMHAFNEETLVCPEGRKGTDMGDWQRAGKVTDLHPLFMSTRIATALRGSEDTGLRDHVDQLRKRISEVESAMERLEHQIKDRDAESAKLRSQNAKIDQPLEDKEARSRLDAMESRLSNIESLEREIKSLRDKLQGFEGKQEVKPAISLSPAPAPAMPEAPAPGPVALNPADPARKFNIPDTLEITVESPTFTSALSEPTGVKLKVQPPPAPAAPTFAEFTAANAELPPPPSMASPLLADLASAASTTPSGPDPFALPVPPTQPKGGATEKTVPLPPAPMDIGSAPVFKKGWSGKQKLALFGLVFMFVGAVSFYAFFSTSPEKSDTDANQSEQQTSNSATQNTSASGKTQTSQTAVAPQEEAPPQVDLSQEAVDLVKAYKVTGSQQGLDEVLKAAYPKAYPQNGELSPWMVDKLDTEKYQVNFYVGTRPVYVFLVQPKSQKVQGYNSAAISLLSGEPIQVQPPVAKKKRHKTANKKAAQKSKAKSKAKSAAKPAAKPAKKNVSLDQLLDSDSGSVSVAQ